MPGSAASASARSSPARSRACRSSISGTVPGSFTGTTLATTPADPSAARALTRPSNSSAPLGPPSAELQLDSTTRCGARCNRSRSYTVSGPSSSSSAENKRAVGPERPVRREWTNDAPSIAFSTASAVAAPSVSTTASGYSSDEPSYLLVSRRQLGTTDQYYPIGRRRHGLPGAQPGRGRRSHRGRPMPQGRQQTPRNGMQPTSRYDDHRTVLQMPDRTDRAAASPAVPRWRRGRAGPCRARTPRGARRTTRGTSDESPARSGRPGRDGRGRARPRSRTAGRRPR